MRARMRNRQLVAAACAAPHVLVKKAAASLLQAGEKLERCRPLSGYPRNNLLIFALILYLNGRIF
jgi:hypothetical protein